jgi:ATP-dependent DNA helicase MPH1
MLGNLAQVMSYLVSYHPFKSEVGNPNFCQLEATTGMAYSYFKEISEKDTDDQARKNQQTQSKRLRENIMFKKTLEAFESHRSTITGTFLAHPKMEKATDILVKYYGQRLPENEHDESEENWGRSKVMVFVTHREAVDEIVDALNSHQPMLRASKFVGQGIGKYGKKGQTQKEQLEVLTSYSGLLRKGF